MALIKANYFCHCLWSLVYFDIEAMIDGEVFVVGHVIPDQYSLNKM